MSKYVTAAITRTVPAFLDALARFHFEDVVRLNRVQGTLSLTTDQLNRILWLAAFVDDC